MLEVAAMPRPDWAPLPDPGCRGVEARVLLVREGLALALLRFAPGGTIHEHAAEHPIEVLGLEGTAHTSVGGETTRLRAGQRVRWPAGVPHRLWTEPDEAALTLMVESPRPRRDGATSRGAALDGGCFCGAVRFRLTPPTEFCGHCHCANCRRAHGAPFVTWTSVRDEAFAFLAGEERVRWHASRAGVRWGFCGGCGSSMLYRSEEAPGRTYVTVASFPEGVDRLPESHVSYEERAPWLDVAPRLPCYRAKSEERLDD